MPPEAAPQWDEHRLEEDRQKAISAFREERISESLGVYAEYFERYRDAVENLLESTADLTLLQGQAEAVVSDPELLYAAQYLPGPPISRDDLKVLADVALASAGPDAAEAAKVVETLLLGLDRGRFPWLNEEREATEEERHTAVIATASLMASQRMRTHRAMESPAAQELLVKDSLKAAGFVEDAVKAIANLAQAPAIGHFAGESVLGTRKADIVVRLWDGRLLAIECKVSNSQTNSIKRLTNDAAVKARVWLEDFGRANIVPAAMLAGVFGLRHLKEAQARGLTIFWSHSLQELMAFIAATKP